MTPEEKLAEKLRLQKIQEEADLRAAMDTFGVTADKSGLDAFNPTNKIELAEFTDALSKKISQYKHLEDYPGFLEELVRNLCVTCKYFGMCAKHLLNFTFASFFNVLNIFSYFFF